MTVKRDWIFTVENSVCDLRTVGVLIRDGKILVQRDRGGNEYALPGGHVKIGETLDDGLIREFKEETDGFFRIFTYWYHFYTSILPTINVFRSAHTWCA